MYITEKGQQYSKSEINESDFHFNCIDCGSKTYINSGLNYHMREGNKSTTYCKLCKNKGERNPFYGKKHTDETRKSLSDAAKVRMVGENNPFYGKTHTDETRKALSNALKGKLVGEKNPFYGKKHTDETKEKIRQRNVITKSKWSDEDKNTISKNMSIAQKRIKSNNPEKYIDNRRKAAKASCMSINRYTMNSIEKKVVEAFKSYSIEDDMKYSVILDYKQFDFGCKKHRILLEVMGDYWHGNPLSYNETGSNNRKILNETQLKNIEKDIKKAEFAKKHGFRLFYIWESDIKNGKYDVIKMIAKIIKGEK